MGFVVVIAMKKRVALEPFKLLEKVSTEDAIDPVKVVLPDRDGKPQTFDSRTLGGNPDVSRILLGAFCLLWGDCERLTRRGKWSDLGFFVRWLVEQHVVDSFDTIDEKLLGAYLLHLKAQGDRLAPRTLYVRFKTVEELCCKAAHTRGRSIQRRYMPFPGVGGASKPIPHVSAPGLIAIVAAAKKEVTRAWQTFKSTSEVDPASFLGRALARARDNYGGVMPVTKRDQVMRNLVAKAGGLESVENLLYGTADVLIAYMILIAFETAANAECVREISRDCLQADSLFDERMVIAWEKRRSTREQRVSRDARGRFSAPRLIEHVLELTAPLVPVAPIHQQNNLFLVRLRSSNQNMKHQAALMSTTVCQDAIARFLQRNDIREPDGRPVDFELRMMRPSVLAEVYRQTGDILVTYRLANHSDLATTVRYVIDRVTDDIHDGVIADTQSKLSEAIVSAARSVEKEITEEGPEAPIIGLERDCKDPYNGRGSGRRGERCPEWLFPLLNPGFLVPNDIHYVANLVRRVEQLESQRQLTHPARFAKYYQAEYDVITRDILPKLDQHLVVEAKEHARRLPALPVFEHE